MSEKYKYFVINKPYGMLTQFSGEESNLSQLDYPFPKDVYPVGRLDKDSEGLLLLTNDHHLQHRLTDPKFSHERTYYVQVEGIPDDQAIQQLQEGVEITLPNKKKHLTLPARCHKIEVPDFPERNPPIRVRLTVPDTWISLTLTEGKNRQVRKMTAKVGHPTLRLVRFAIEDLTLDHLEGKTVKEWNKDELYKFLQL